MNFNFKLPELSELSEETIREEAEKLIGYEDRQSDIRRAFKLNNILRGRRLEEKLNKDITDAMLDKE